MLFCRLRLCQRRNLVVEAFERGGSPFWGRVSRQIKVCLLYFKVFCITCWERGYKFDRNYPWHHRFLMSSTYRLSGTSPGSLVKAQKEPNFMPHLPSSFLTLFSTRSQLARLASHTTRSPQIKAVRSSCWARETSLLPPERFMPASEGLATASARLKPQKQQNIISHYLILEQ